MTRWMLILITLVLWMPISHVKSVTIADGANTDIVRPSDWNSGHNYTLQDAVSLSGNTSGVLSNVSSGTFYLAGGNNITLSQDGNSVTVSGPNTTQFLTTAMASNRGSDFVQATAAFAGTSASGTIASGGISVSIGPYLTTAMLSNAATISNIRVSAGTTSNLLSAVTFSNINGISFGLDASTLTASHNALTSQSNQAASASNGSFTFQTLAFSNANNVTFGTSAGSIISASVAAAGGTMSSATTVSSVATANAVGADAGRYALEGHQHGGIPIVSIVGNTSGTTTQGNLSFNLAGGPNITLSCATAAGAMTVSVSAPAPGGAGAARSYFQWPEENANSSALQVSGSTKFLQPFRLPYDLSVSYLRIPLTLSCVGSNAAMATAANQTVGCTISSTLQLAFYSMGAGANSRSLQSYFTTSHSWVQRLTIQAAGVGSNWSSGHTISYPMSSSASAAFTTSGPATSTSRTMNSSVISNFTNLRFLDLLMETSFSAGAWWMAWNSSTSQSTIISNWLSTQRILASNFAVSQPPQSINLMNLATNSSNLMHQGLGDWSTNSIGTTTGSIALSQLSRRASNPIIWFQMIRQA